MDDVVLGFAVGHIVVPLRGWRDPAPPRGDRGPPRGAQHGPRLPRALRLAAGVAASHTHHRRTTVRTHTRTRPRSRTQLASHNLYVLTKH